MVHLLLYSVLPIIAVMGTGYLSGKFGAFDAADARKMNRLVLDFALPAALFVAITQAPRPLLIDDIKLAMVCLGVFAAVFVATYYIYGHCFKGIGPAQGAVMAMISASPGVGFMGFAVLEPYFGKSPEVSLVIAIGSIVVNGLGVALGLVLLNEADADTAAKIAGSGRKPSVWKPVVKTLRQPVLWMPVAGIVWVALGLEWPQWAYPSFDLIKGANASLAIFAGGITLSSVAFVVNWQALLGSLIKYGLLPGVLLAVGILLEMRPDNIKMLMMAMGVPPAFSGVMVAADYGKYVSVGTSSLAISVVLFIVACPLWIWITDRVVPIFLN